jgi:hypothetical protein
MSWKLKRGQPDEHEALPHFDIGIGASLDEVMDFDRKICAMGCKRFMRNLTDFDFPFDVVDDQRQQGCTQVVVQEMFPGARKRTVVGGYVIPLHEITDHPERN